MSRATVETEQVERLYGEYMSLRNELVHGGDITEPFRVFCEEASLYAHVTSREVGVTPDEMIGNLWADQTAFRGSAR